MVLTIVSVAENKHKKTQQQWSIKMKFSLS